MKPLVRSLIVAAGFALSGCLISDAPLLDDATATPIPSGSYDACDNANEDAPSCSPMTVEINDGAYILTVDDDVISAHFADLGDGQYAAQLIDAGGDQEYMYYWASLEGGALSLSLIWCADLPTALVDGLVASGDLEADADRSTCKAKTQAAVIAAARSYASGETKSDARVSIQPIAASE